MRENKLYRSQLERLDKAYPDKEILSIAEVARFTGKSPNTIRKYLRSKMGGYTKVAIASLLTEGQ